MGYIIQVPGRCVFQSHAMGSVIRFLSSPMMTSSNGNIFRVTGHLCGNSPVTGEFPAQRPVTRSFDVFFDLRLNIWLSKQSWGWWFETPSRSLWRNCNVLHLHTFLAACINFILVTIILILETCLLTRDQHVYIHKDMLVIFTITQVLQLNPVKHWNETFVLIGYEN